MKNDESTERCNVVAEKSGYFLVLWKLLFVGYYVLTHDSLESFLSLELGIATLRNCENSPNLASTSVLLCCV